MTTPLPVEGLPFDLVASHPVWNLDDSGAVSATALPGTDFYVNPEGAGAGDEQSVLTATTLLGIPPSGDFQLGARVTVDFRSKYDAGVLMIWINDRNWAKFCFEFSPDAEPMVVSVVTRDTSDDSNAFVVPERTVWMRLSRLGRAYAFHASTDGSRWRLIRVFTFGDQLIDHRVGFEAQSPTGDGCTVTFDDIRFTSARLSDLRDGT